MENINVRVFVARVMALLASVAAPVTNAQSWETINPGAQVAFDRRDDEGRIYFRMRNLVKDGRPAVEPGGTPSKMVSYKAADCSKGLLYNYSEYSKQWGDPRKVDLRIGSYSDVAFDYVCKTFTR